MSRLWNTAHQDQSELDSKIHRFLTAKDVDLDNELIVFDIQASKAHAQGLNQIGIFSDEECERVIQTLAELEALVLKKEFTVTYEYEDCHSAIEMYLTQQLGDLGKKIHTGRSRNDQVLVATRLYSKAKLKKLMDINATIAVQLLAKAKHYQTTPMPGYTHLQRAVVSSWGMWFAAFLESFIDNIDYANKILNWIDANPLGTAAGYGVNLPLDRELTTQALDFDRLQINPIYAQNSRGKFELSVLSCFKQSMLDARKLAWDLSLFTMSELDFVSLPDAYTTGSSIMPNKRNPDVVELIRASYSRIQADYQQLENLLALPSGYHRDLQFTKEPLMNGITSSLACLDLLPALLQDLTVNKEQSVGAIEKAMFKTDMSIDYAAQGVPFRDAYMKLKSGDEELLKGYSAEVSIEKRVSPGACGDLMLDVLEGRLKSFL